jgi:two-component sensor histidine kinase
MGVLPETDVGPDSPKTIPLFEDETPVAAEAALRDSVKQKGILMKELQHRVKNSLAVVSGLLGLGSETLTDERAGGILTETRSRIRSIAALYEQLYGTEAPESVDLYHDFQRLIESFFKTYVRGARDIRLKTSLAEVRLDTKRAVPLGLILNELVTNSLKYAYPGEENGELRIDLERGGDMVVLGVPDDGPGPPSGFGLKTSGGMGLSRVRMLAQEYGGELSCSAGAKGTRVLIRLKL